MPKPGSSPHPPRKSRLRKLAASLLKRYGGLINKYTDFHVASKPDFHVSLNQIEDFETLYEIWVRKEPKNNRTDLARFYFLYLQIQSLEARGIAGAFAELGVFRGTTAKLFRMLAPERELFLFDTFEGFAAEDTQREEGLSAAKAGKWAASLEGVRSYVGEANTWFIKGRFPETAGQVPEQTQFALVHLDSDLYAPQIEGLRFFYPRMVKGGAMIMHDCNNSFAGSRKALDEFFAGKAESPVFIPDKSGSAIVIKL
jgi:O-methyltransferase